LAWFGGLFVLWLLLVGTIADTELTAGLIAAAIGATATEVVRSLGLLGFHVEWRWVNRTPKHLAAVIPDFFLVLATLVRPRRGAFRTLAFPTGGGRDIDRGRRAWAGLAASLAPNRVVVDVDEETGLVLVHDLVPRAAPDEVV
jgi:multisubunit Na+/H+ antiporter MnhE subunit